MGLRRRQPQQYALKSNQRQQARLDSLRGSPRGPIATAAIIIAACLGAN
jgi:hypothetical protein